MTSITNIVIVIIMENFKNLEYKNWENKEDLGKLAHDKVVSKVRIIKIIRSKKIIQIKCYIELIKI